jgi:uncharacterized membrane protein
MTTKTVTFTVKDSDNAAIEGATIEILGARLKTNASGQAVFNLRAGDYSAKITAKGYNSATEAVTVAASAVTKTVTLTAKS